MHMARKGYVGVTISKDLAHSFITYNRAGGPLMASDYNSAILLVEDDRQARRFLSSTLKAAGYDVLEAQSGLEAMAVALSYPGEIPLAILDIVMPVVSGLDVANQLAMDRPTTTILYISGFTDSIAVDSISRRKPQSVLRKPFTPSEFLARVRKLVRR